MMLPLEDSFRKTVIAHAQKLAPIIAHHSGDKGKFELEFRLGKYSHGQDHFYASQSLLQFKNVIEKLHKLGLHMTEETSLDIRIGNERLTITPAENGDDIRNYCRSEEIGNLSRDSLEYMTKVTLDKSANNPQNIYDYDLRLQLSLESIITSETKIIQFNQNIMNQSIEKSYRYKHRYSFTCEDLPIRIDLTVVKSGDKGATTFRQSHTLTADEKYEVEIEFIDLKKGTQIESLFTNATIGMLYNIIRWSQDSFAVSTTQDRENVQQQYDKLAFPHKETKENLFIGLDVLPLTRDKFNTIRVGYSVTEKADGERYLLYISNDGMIYLINNRMEIKHTGLQNKVTQLNNSIFDGELVVRKKDHYSHIYLIFDCFFFNSIDLRNSPLYANEKLELFKNVDITNVEDEVKSRYAAVVWSSEHLKTEYMTILSGEISLEFRHKVYEFAHKGADTTIYELAKKVYDKKDLYDYNLDGIIFTPYLEPYPKIIDRRLPWEQLLKWKPMDQLSIDFGVVFISKHPLIDFNTKQNYIEAKLKAYKRSDRKGDTNPYNSWVDFVPRQQEAQFNIVKLVVDHDNRPRTLDNNIIYDYSVVEFIYDDHRTEGFKWVPIKFRPDKTDRKIPNAFNVALSTWSLILNPVSLHMITTGQTEGVTQTIEDVYYMKTETVEDQGMIVNSLRTYHNSIKFLLFDQVTNQIRLDRLSKGESMDIDLLDIACGQGGDLRKWNQGKITYVLGIDVFKSGLDEAVKRHAAGHYPFKFDTVWGNSGLLLNSGAAGQDPAAKILLRKILTQRGRNSFDIVSCQFAFHYFAGDEQTLNNVLINITTNLKLGGYFIGTTFDGEKVFNALKPLKENESLVGKKNDTEIWHIKKEYTSDHFDNVGQKIGAFNINIGHEISEYLVNFRHLIEVANTYGLVPIKPGNVPELVGLQSFADLFGTIIKHNPKHAKTIIALKNPESVDEMTYSFLNNYFVFKKIKEMLPEGEATVKLGGASTEKLKSEPSPGVKKIVLKRLAK